MTGRVARAQIGWCDQCGKYLLSSRKAARAEARKLRGGHPSVYPCPVVANLWHVGNLSPQVVKGQLTRYQAYGGKDED
jgi:hypothetical protein